VHEGGLNCNKYAALNFAAFAAAEAGRVKDASTKARPCTCCAAAVACARGPAPRVAPVSVLRHAACSCAVAPLLPQALCRT